ncbi:hypothetical protein LCGC14_2902860, partial [marine sediment metagenome]
SSLTPVPILRYSLWMRVTGSRYLVGRVSAVVHQLAQVDDESVAGTHHSV